MYRIIFDILVCYDIDWLGICDVPAEARQTVTVDVAVRQDAVLAPTHDLTLDHHVSCFLSHCTVKLSYP